MSVRVITEQILFDFCQYLRINEKSRNTIEKYLRDVKKYQVYLNGGEADRLQTMSYKQNLIECGYAYTSVNSMLASLNSFFDYLGWSDCKVKNLKLQRKIYLPQQLQLTRKDVQKLIEKASEQKKERLALLIQTLCLTGIRISELEFLTVESLENGEFTVSCKGKIRTVLIVRKLQKKLLRYVQKNNIMNGPIFVTKYQTPIHRTSVWKQLKNLCIAAQIQADKVFPHNFRHLFARMFYSQDKDIAKLADVLGHSSINTTRIYIMTSSDEHRKILNHLNLIL